MLCHAIWQMMVLASFFKNQQLEFGSLYNKMKMENETVHLHALSSWKVAWSLWWQCSTRTSVPTMIHKTLCRWFWPQRCPSVREPTEVDDHQIKALIKSAPCYLMRDSAETSNSHHAGAHSHLQKLGYTTSSVSGFLRSTKTSIWQHVWTSVISALNVRKTILFWSNW